MSWGETTRGETGLRAKGPVPTLISSLDSQLDFFYIFFDFRVSRGLVGVSGSLIPEISVGIQMERSVSVSSDRNIQDPLWRWPHISVGIFRPKFAVPF